MTSLLVGVLAFAVPAAADVADFVGKPLADVRVEVAGQPTTEPAVLQLIQTRVGEPLRIEQVRETIDHLVGLGRFEDVRVYAEPAATRAGGVSVRWVLTPVQRIAEIALAGDLRLPADALRGQLTDRFGARPSTTRVPEMITLLQSYYADRGYRAVRIEPRLVPTTAPELVNAALTIDPGPRTHIGRIDVSGAAPIPREQLLRRLDLAPGRPYDRVAIQARVDAYEEELRRLGHYEASVAVRPAFRDDAETADVAVDVAPGPHVQVVFAGDPLPEGRRDTLVPIREERSVDLDLLEDASRNIESFLRQQGYRAAQAPYTREQRGNEMVLTFTVARGPLHTLASVDFTGNDAVSRAELAPLMQLKPGEPFVDSRVATVASAITELYRVRGFARAVVKPDITVSGAAPGQSPRPVSVRFVIAEGPRTMLGAVTIEGAGGIAESRIRALLTLGENKPFYRPQLEADRQAIERLYRNEGFQAARVAPDTVIADEGRRVDLRWVIREGERTTVDHVLVTGNVHTTAALIRDEIVLKPDQPLGEDAIVESQRRLASLGLFRRVHITEMPHGASAAHDVLVEVEEAPLTSISEGGGLEAMRRLRPGQGGRAEPQFEVAPRGFFEISRRNLWGRNRTLTLFTRVSFRPTDPAVDDVDSQGGYGFNEYRVLGTLREPRPFNRPGESQFTGFFEQAVRSSFNFNRRGGRAEYARRFGTALTVSGRYTFDYTKLFDEKIKPEDRLLVDRLFPQVRLSMLTGSVLRDSRNDALDPERGTVTGIDGSIAPRAIGSEVGFVRTFVQGAIYRRLPTQKRFIIATAARIGLAKGFKHEVERINEPGSFDIVLDLPASERFFAGGDTTVRGFVLDQLGAADTLDAQGFPTGGNALIVLNLELRAPYWKGVGPVVFFDAGNVFKRVSDFSIADIRPAAGFGIRYRSPVGPLRVDLGFNLDPQLLASGARERGSVLHISLGQAF